MDIVEFLNARLDEGEAAAQAVIDAGGRSGWEAVPIAELDGRRALTGGSSIFAVMDPVPEGRACAEHAARHDPARVLREVAAKRKMLELHANGCPGINYCVSCWNGNESLDWPCPTVRTLASAHADHPDYAPEWAPRT
ncbi:hypothetical protein KGD82_13485 [Nocardiopsis eucommiae]|uniref:Uncharacterized protein n=1 Tax=Nocardiopsis eucommiae TaxID=2831970 RepID=A0A975LC20_9ACTN|nr:hypothetical protein KGD82_13485 [Nocardiopsis eucommiae]